MVVLPAVNLRTGSTCDVHAAKRETTGDLARNWRRDCPDEELMSFAPAVERLVSGQLVVLDLERRVLEPRGFVSWVVNNTRCAKFSELAVMRVRVGGSRPEDGSDVENYFVEALGAEGKWRVEHTSQYLKARQTAELFATHIGLGIVDEVIGDVREADTFEEPLQDRIRRKGPLSPLPAPPPGLLVKVAGAELRVQQSQLSTRGFSTMEGLAVLLHMTTLICYLAPFITDTPDPCWPLIAGIYLVGVGVALVIETVKRLTPTDVHTSVRVGPAGLKIAIRERGTATIVEMSDGALDGVGVAKDPEPLHGSSAHPLRILAVSRHRVVSFGVGWPPAQQQWLVLAIQHALSADTFTLPVGGAVDAQ